jgi:hypothetical protein
MLVYAKRAAPKEPKRRSRAGELHRPVLYGITDRRSDERLHTLVRASPPHSDGLANAIAVRRRYSLPSRQVTTSDATQKKKCNEARPRCDRCTEKGLVCGYETVKPRKQRRVSFAGSAQSNGSDSPPDNENQWSGQYKTATGSENGVDKWEIESEYQYAEPEAEVGGWHGPLDDVEEIVRSDPAPIGAMVRSRSQYPDLAMIAPSPVPSPLLEFGAPVFMEFTDKKNRRMLVDHFCNVMSHLIVFKEDTGNPFRQLVLPLSHASSPVMNAIFALSSAHLEYRGVQNREKSLDFHNRALQGLAKQIEQNDPSNREEVLGAIMLLVYYEVVSFPLVLWTSYTDENSSFNKVTLISSTGI